MLKYLCNYTLRIKMNIGNILLAWIQFRMTILKNHLISWEFNNARWWIYRGASQAPDWHSHRRWSIIFTLMLLFLPPMGTSWKTKLTFRASAGEQTSVSFTQQPAALSHLCTKAARGKYDAPGWYLSYSSSADSIHSICSIYNCSDYFAIKRPWQFYLEN